MWEYKVITWVGGNSEVLLNEMGAQGWDLCGIKGDDFIFKRNKDKDTYNPYYPYCPVTPYYINTPCIITSGTIPASSASSANSVSTTI